MTIEFKLALAALDALESARCPDCGGTLTRDHHTPSMEHMGVLISPCDDRRIAADGQ